MLFGVHPYDMVAIRQLDEIFSTGQPRRPLPGPARERDHRGRATSQTASRDVFAGCMGTATVERRRRLRRAADPARRRQLPRGCPHREGRGPAERLAGGRAAADATTSARGARVWERNRETLRKHELKHEPRRPPGAARAELRPPGVGGEGRALLLLRLLQPGLPHLLLLRRARTNSTGTWRPATRLRTWDGCMLADFAAVAGDHNFREQKAARYRHRYYRKGKYVPDMIGEDRLRRLRPLHRRLHRQDRQSGGSLQPPAGGQRR